jgi:two-component system chemotaxis response regulator CheY
MSANSYENLKALIVEDNAHMRALLRSLLQALGIRSIHESNDGASGFAELCARNPDIVLTDLSMAPTDGIALTNQIRKGSSPNPYVPIIMVTGHTKRARVEAARDAGVTEFLAKPITVQNLTARLMEIVERPRPFVRCGSYFGPERRRRKLETYTGPWRRKEDFEDDLEIR